MKTNSLTFTAHKVATNGDQYQIDIRLDDECKNGHQDFSITGTIWEPGKVKANRNMISGGAIGDKIAANFPEFAIFNNLHLCDYKGIPMYAAENGFYHLQNGFNNAPAESPEFKEEFCKYYRMTEEQFSVISKSENILEYAILLKELGILAQWETEAKEAIKLLEELTGNEFVIDSQKTQYHAPKEEDINLFKERKEAGYYSEDNKKQRAEAEQLASYNKKVQKIKDEAESECKAIILARDLDLLFLSAGVSSEKYIHYTHNKTIKFNWNAGPYNKPITKEQAVKAATTADSVLKANGIICYFDGIAINNL